jgi:GT2 family glycosyltransferase
LSAEAWTPQVSFIILNFNDRPHLGPCLDAVAQHAAAIPHETIVVDNASTDDSVQVVAATRTGFTLLRNAENVGFARAMNRGAAASRGEFLAFLNTDVVLRPGTMEALLAEFDRNPSTGAVGPALRTPGGGYQSRSAAGGLSAAAFPEALPERRQAAPSGSAGGGVKSAG